MKTTEIVEKLMEKGIIVTPELLAKIKNGYIPEEIKEKAPKIEIIENYTKLSSKRTVEDFVAYFNNRFETIEKMLRKRSEVKYATSISRTKTKTDNEQTVIIGIVKEVNETKNNNIIITLEDRTGTITTIAHNKSEIIEKAKEVVPDEVIAITGRYSKGTVFITDIIFPDIPITELKKGTKEEYMAIVGDVHYGSKQFLEKEFKTLIEWFNGRIGNEKQKIIAKKTKYIIFVGDIIEGIGVYPNQEEDLTIKDLYQQFEGFAQIIKKIPEDKRIIIIPGNHEPVRIAEPQPPIPKEYAPTLHSMQNVTLLSNPTVFTIGKTEKFPGYTILLYHGYSLTHYAENIQKIRSAGGQKRADMIMKLLLQKRHLAPTHGSNQYLPDPEKDPMIIRTIPDFFITGHIHRVSVSQYKGITMINASCWTKMTENQEKRGLENQPGRLPIINLKTREIKLINFVKEK